MSAPNPNNPYYAAYATSNPSAYDYLQYPPRYDAFVDPAMPMAFNDCIYGTTQPFFASDNFFPTTTPEFHSNETNYVQSIGSSGSRDREMSTKEDSKLMENSDAESDYSSDMKIEINDSITRIIDTVEDLAAITREHCVATEDNSRAIGDVSASVGSLSKRMDDIENTVERLARTMDEVLKCERTALERFGNLSGRLERPVSTGINIVRRSS